MTPVLESVELSTGVRLEYVEQGDPSGVPVVLLHGITDSWRSFSPVLPYLPDWIRAFAISQRGHGDSARPEGGYRPSDFAADIAAFLDAKGIDRAVVVGHSMGGIVAMRLALDHPNRVMGLVLVDTFLKMRGNAEIEEFYHSTIAVLEDPVDSSLAREFQESTLSRPIEPAFFETVVRESLKLPARVWRDAFGGLLDVDFSDEIGAVDVATLVLWGDRDTYCSREDQEELASAMPAARLEVYRETGHALHWEEPERFASDLTVFASRQTATTVA
jgi:pimeloyl-ACP methyl ester carboxylesterase